MPTGIVCSFCTDAEFGYRRAVSHLLGDKRRSVAVHRTQLLDSGLSGEPDEFDLLVDLMTDVTLNDAMDGRFERLFSGLEFGELPAKFEL